MKTNRILYIIIAATASVLISCEKDEIEPRVNQSSHDLALTPEQIQFRDSVVASIQAQGFEEEDNAKTQRVVTISAKETGCHSFRLTVNVNRDICPRPGGTLAGYWTLFSTSGIKNLPPTPGDPCLDEGPQFSLNYTAESTHYVKIVLLLFDPVTRQSNGLFISNTIVLTPDC